MGIVQVADSIQGNPIRISLGCEVETVGRDATWIQRVRRINRLLRRTKATHMLGVQHQTSNQTTYYVGKPGISLAAGVEGMLQNHESMHDSIVVLPLDDRMYWAETKGDAVVNEGAQITSRFEALTHDWQQKGLTTVLLSGGGMASVDIQPSIELPVDMDTEAIELLPASRYLLSQGLVRTRDCYLMGLLVLCGMFGWFGTQFLLDSYETPVAMPEIPSIIEPLFVESVVHTDGNAYLAQSLWLLTTLLRTQTESSGSISWFRFDGSLEPPQIEVEGTSVAGSGAQLVAIEKAFQGSLVRNPQAWRLEMPIRQPVSIRQDGEEEGLESHLVSLIVQEFPGLKQDHESSKPERWHFHWSELAEPQATLIDFIRVTQGVPYHLENLHCEIDRTRVSHCELALSFPIAPVNS